MHTRQQPYPIRSNRSQNGDRRPLLVVILGEKSPAAGKGEAAHRLGQPQGSPDHCPVFPVFRNVLIALRNSGVVIENHDDYGLCGSPSTLFHRDRNDLLSQQFTLRAPATTPAPQTHSPRPKAKARFLPVAGLSLYTRPGVQPEGSASRSLRSRRLSSRVCKNPGTVKI